MKRKIIQILKDNCCAFNYNIVSFKADEKNNNIYYVHYVVIDNDFFGMQPISQFCIVDIEKKDTIIGTEEQQKNLEKLMDDADI